MGLTADQNIPTQQSKAEDWIAWYQEIPGSKVTANNVWLAVWQARNGATSAANTSELRSWMSANAGITLTTDGIGSLIDSSKSLVDTIEDMALVPVEIVGGLAVLTLLFGGFMIYKAFENPEQTEGLVESAGKIAAIAA